MASIGSWLAANAAQNEYPLRLFRCWLARRADAPFPNGREMGNPAFSHEFGTAAGRHGMTQSILVTGGAGYIGSHACKVLAAAGYRPVVYDNLSRGHREAVRWGPLIEGSLAERSKLAAALASHRISVVMHFAAYAYVGESVTAPSLYYANNLGGSLSLLEAMREARVDKIVFSSTCPTYGTPAQVPIRETLPQLPVNPYGE